MAKDLGELLGSDKQNSTLADQRFCIGLTSGLGWKTSLSVTNVGTGEKAVILTDYCILSIQCRFCLSTNHLVKNCGGLLSKREENIAQGD